MVCAAANRGTPPANSKISASYTRHEAQGGRGSQATILTVHAGSHSVIGTIPANELLHARFNRSRGAKADVAGEVIDIGVVAGTSPGCMGKKFNTALRPSAFSRIPISDISSTGRLFPML